jgi:hypothetical protein
MFKKIFGTFVVMVLLANLLSACGGTSSNNNAQTSTTPGSMAGTNGSSMTDDEAQNLLKSLTAKARLTINQPGWVHVNEKIVYDTDKQDRGTLMNGASIPLKQTIDVWYHINDAKLVYEYVWIMTNQDGDTIDIGVYLHNNLFDLINNTSTPQDPYHLSLDYQFEDEMSSFISRSGHPVVTTDNVNGRNATVFALSETLSAPKTTTDYNQPFVAAGSIAYFDSETGFLLRIVRTVTFADGTTRTFYTDNLSIELNVQPPTEVQNYVNGFW